MAGKKKTSQLTEDGIEALAADKPVVYKILDKKGENIYTGVAKRGRVQERIAEHLPNGPDAVPGGTKVRIDQKSSIQEARDSEARIIKRSRPRHNKQGK